MNTFKFIGISILCIVLGIGTIFGVSFLSLTLYRTFATRWESSKTDVYRENKSYVEGTIRDLRQLKKEYIIAEEEHKDSLRSLILHRANELDWDRLPSDLRTFLHDLEED